MARASWLIRNLSMDPHWRPFVRNPRSNFPQPRFWTATDTCPLIRLIGSYRSDSLWGERRRRAADMYCTVLLIKHIIALRSSAARRSKRRHGSIRLESQTRRLCRCVPAGLSTLALQSGLQNLCLPFFSLSRILSRVRRRWRIRRKWAASIEHVRGRRHSAGSLGNRRRFGFDE
jgi:hypothetical protein